WFRYRSVDIRDLDGDRLLGSDEVGDVLIAILARLRDHKEAVRRILSRIAGLESGGRQQSLSQLLVLAGLRRLEETVEQEARKMPVLIDIMENKVLGREYKRGLQEGEMEGELKILRGLLAKRFGSIPDWAQEHLSSRSTAELEELSLRFLDS